MQRLHNALIIIGSVFLGISGLFVAINVLQYEIGVPLPWSPFDALYAGAQSDVARYALDGLIVFGPVIGIAAYVLTMLDIQVSLKGDQLATIVIHRSNRTILFLVGACVVTLALFGTYLLAENWPCLIGRQVAC